MSQDSSNNQPKASSNTLPRVYAELSRIASNPKKSKVFILAFLIVSGFFAYRMFTQEDVKDTKKKAEVVEQPKKVVTPPKDINYTQELTPPELAKITELKEIKKDEEGVKEQFNIPSVNTAVQIPEEITRPPDASSNPPIVSSPIATPQSGSANINIPKNELSDQEKQKKKKKQESAIMVVEGTPKKSVETIAEEATYKLRQNIDRTLGRGKIIDAAIETAINTDFLSDIRAVVTRDVYSESGKVILIPKGSRVHGNASATIVGSTARINITWDRLDLPNGFFVNLASIGVDNLGRAGVQGRLDPKIKEQVSATILSSALNIVFAGAMDKLISSSSNNTLIYDGANVIDAVNGVFNNATITNNYDKMLQMCNTAKNAVSNTTSNLYGEITSQCTSALSGATDVTNVQNLYNNLIASANRSESTAASSETTRSSTVTQTKTASIKAMTDFAKTIDDIVKKNTAQPNMTLDQGAQIKIYVNKDYVFPRTAIQSSRLLQ